MAERQLKRKIYDELLKWKNEYAPEYALFIKGARRVGKTTMAEELGRKEYKSFVTVNFQSANDTIRDLSVTVIIVLICAKCSVDKVSYILIRIVLVFPVKFLNHDDIGFHGLENSDAMAGFIALVIA